MTKHYNGSIIERLNRIFRPKAGDQFTDEISGPVAVIPVTPVSRIIRAAGSSTSGSITALTTPADKDFYLTGCTLSMIKDATCDMATGAIALAVTVDGVAQNPAAIAILTLTAQSQTVNVTFNPPIKVDRNTALSMGASYTAGTMRRFLGVYGYTEETTAS